MNQLSQYDIHPQLVVNVSLKEFLFLKIVCKTTTFCSDQRLLQVACDRDSPYAHIGNGTKESGRLNNIFFLFILTLVSLVANDLEHEITKTLLRYPVMPLVHCNWVRM